MISPAITMTLASLGLLAANLVAALLLINSSQKTQVLSSHLEALRTNQRNVTTLEDNVLTYSSQIDTLMGALPHEAQIPEFIEFVNTIAKKHTIEIIFNFASDQPAKTKDKLTFIPLNLEFTTSPAKVNLFLDDLQGGAYQIRFNHFETGVTPTGEVKAKLSANLFVADPFSAAP